MISAVSNMTLFVLVQEQKLVFIMLSKTNFFCFLISFSIFILHAGKVRSHIWDRGVERVGVFPRWILAFKQAVIYCY